ncbi:MAG: hypothetical protein ABIR11_10780, partial [Candidatus Limnocylindrales bacterium]
MRRHPVLGRAGQVALSVLLAVSSFVVSASPATVPIPRPAELRPQPVAALACADEPVFTGHLTTSTTSTTAITRTRSGGVRGYISQVVDNWSCTSYYRYDGLAWARNATNGNFEWGSLIATNSVACNWALNSTDYLKANATTDCPDSDAEYANAITLGNNGPGTLLEGIYHADNSPDELGDFYFIHSDCSPTWYGSNPIVWVQGFATTGNRPGANCDPTVADGTGSSQTVIVDGTAPTLAFSAPAGVSGTVVGTQSAGYTVSFSATDTLAGFDATHLWSLQRHRALR